jgi:hypothetical protein
VHFTVRYLRTSDAITSLSLSLHREYELSRSFWEEREKVGGGSERHYNKGGSETIIFDLKVPRHCPLVLLIRVRLEFRVN